MRQPMVTPLGRTAYQLSQGVRLGWYSAQSVLTTRLSERIKAPPELREEMPTAADLTEGRQTLLRRELRNIEAGFYRLPHDMIADPVAMLRRTVRYFADLRDINQRLRRGETATFDTPAAQRYPDYYRRGFHNQTDGYLSRRSAELYDHQVEVLFGGVADVMRRQALVPLYELLRGRRIAETRLIDIACGTGQFLTFVKDNYPRLPVTALDISPFYLDEARRRLRRWSRVAFLEGTAEAIDVPDASFDVATCVYLFHELPRELHRTVATEMARILKPGGMVILVDSLQLGDRDGYDGLLKYFPLAFHEPYYDDYIRQDLAAVFAAAGLDLERSDLAYLSKVMVLRKPDGAASPSRRRRATAKAAATAATTDRRRTPARGSGKSRR